MKQNRLSTIQDIEKSLALCDELEKQSIVIPLVDIERHFPSERHPAYPNVPSYNYGALKDWAKDKGWKATPSTTGTTQDRSSVPAIRFLRINKINTVPDPQTVSSRRTNQGKQNPWESSIGKIGIAVIGGVIVLFVGYIIKTRFGISL
ncbi:MAG: hypothetical protein D3922_08245 [Candidatus Electrothrix sp. AR1]|nr:hypothetical protein [Candidatus Electrothrix sp. AR1]